MTNKNYLFIAKSLDGYIADKNGGIDWLHTTVPNPENLDVGYNAFIDKVDAIIMGRNTFEVVCSFDIPWPYTRPVFVASTTLKDVPQKLKDKVEIINGSPLEIIKKAGKKGYSNFYIDGGATVQSFLKNDLIDEMIISTIPILLGDGVPLFGNLPKPIKWEYVKSEVFLNAITQDTYRRKRCL